MRTAPELALTDLLHGIQIKCSDAYISNLVKKHPDYPALSCITDTLDHLKIENAAALVTAEEIRDIPFPFLAHLDTGGGAFVIMNDIRQFDDFFFSQWSGVIVVAENPGNWAHPGNTQALAGERKDLHRFVIASILLFALLLPGLLVNTIPAAWYLSLISVTGLLVSAVIVMQDIGIGNGLAQRLCGTGNDCRSVIRWGNKTGFSWSDMAISWFAFLYLVLLSSVFNGSLVNELAYISWFAAAGLAVVPVSIYYQWRVIRKWCRLCLVTAALLLLQFFVVLPFLSFHIPHLSSVIITQNAAWLVLVIMAWLPVKKLLRQEQQLSKRSLELERMKSNPVVFRSLLKQQQQTDMAQWEHELQIGCATAPLQIVVACGAYCDPCAKTHEVLHDIAIHFGDKIGICIRFNADVADPSDLRTQMLRHTLRYIAENSSNMNAYEKAELTRRVLQQWFSTMDMNSFTMQFPVRYSIDTGTTIAKHQEWFARNHIAGTPTLFMNGYALPTSYTIKELSPLLEQMTGEIINQPLSPVHQPA